ncbi:MAG: 2-oxoacid:ferredoxin oxidoreductase subunit beta [Chloroflexi bacterium]|nr:2-oxoacid:ferredoxin oxidoreductase subunit beta [Chloroflexota bacterium]
METKVVELNLCGLALADYKGKPSTLCPGCGHNSISAQVQNAVWELGLPPERYIKLSGIGCSSKSPNYFLDRSFGFNGLHGRMPTLASGACFADSSIHILGFSGDGDTASIGMGHFKHVIRRNVPMTYIIENNGCYGLTKGQFSATSDLGLVLKHQGVNMLPPLDMCMEALISGATFVARAYSGDTKQLKELIKAAVSQRGIAIIDVISPCVTFNNQDDALQSYTWGRENEAPLHDFKHFNTREELDEEGFAPGTFREIKMQDGTYMVLRKIDKEYDPTDKNAALDLLTESYKNKYFATGLIYFSESAETIQELYDLPDEPLNRLGVERLRPTKAMLDEINRALT